MSQNDRLPDGTADPNPGVVLGPSALGVPPPLAPTPPLDAWADGVQKQTFSGEGKGVLREFAVYTRVIYVNGINSNDVETTTEARAYAKAIGGPVEVIHVATHGIVSDLHDAFVETTDQRTAFRNKAEHDVAREVISLATAGKDVHIMAYSRGALVTERGLELAATELRARGFNADYIAKKVFSHVTVETVNGASHTMPDGVRAVHYVSEGDVLVAQSLGMGSVAPETRLGAAALMLAIGDTPGVMSEIRDGVRNHPNGPIREVTAFSSMNPIDQHSFINTIRNTPDHKGRVPFEEAYAPYAKEQRLEAARVRDEMTTHPEPSPGHTPLAHTPQLHVFQNGQAHTVSHGFHEVGRAFNYGGLVGLQHHDVERGLTMIPRHELYAATPQENHAALDTLLRDGKGVEVSIGAKGLTMHEPLPHHQLSPLPDHAHRIERSHIINRSEGMGHER